MNYPGEKDINVVFDQTTSHSASGGSPLTSHQDRKPLLSILTPAVHSRFRQLEWLCAKIERQIGNLAVEHLVLLDNKRRTVGEKRDDLLRTAKGDYVAYVDDDDDISEDYVSELVAAIDLNRHRHDIDKHSQAPTTSHLSPLTSHPDVITFLQKATVNGASAIIEFKLGNPNEPFQPLTSHLSPLTSPRVKRAAWHICAWRRELAVGSAFPPVNYGEDWAYAEPLCLIAETSVHIDKVLHFYRHDSTKTEAPPPDAVPEPSFHPATWGDAGPLYHNKI